MPPPRGRHSPCAAMRSTCCTFSAGGKVSITPMRIAEDALTESTLLDYVRFQSGQQPRFSGSTINQRVAVADRALRAAFPGAPRQIAPEFQVSYWRRAPMGLGRPLPAVSRLRVREPKRTIVPLSVDEVARFWSSFRTSRDLAIVGLMLLQGLRSQEVHGSEPRGSAVAGSADPRARQGQQAPLSAPGSRSRPTAGSLSAAGAARCLRRPLCLSL